MNKTKILFLLLVFVLLLWLPTTYRPKSQVGSTKQLAYSEPKIKENNWRGSLDFKKLESILPVAKNELTETSFRTISRMVPSPDLDEILITISTYDLTKKSDAFSGERPKLEEQNFICFMLENRCQKSDILKKADAKSPPRFIWTIWEPERRQLFGHPAFDTSGVESGVYDEATDSFQSQ